MPRKSRKKKRLPPFPIFGTPVKDLEEKIRRLLDEHGFDLSKVKNTKETNSWVYQKLMNLVTFAKNGNWTVAESIAIMLGKFCRGEFDPRLEDDTSWVQEFLPMVLPSHWNSIEMLDDGCKYISRDKQTVIISGSRELDGNRWLHVSTAFPDRLPSWEELKEVKDIFIGRKKWAIQILPTEDKYVNLNPNVLHLWYCIDQEVLPDFTGGSGNL